MHQIDCELGFVVLSPRGGWLYAPAPGASFVEVVAWSPSLPLINEYLAKHDDCRIAVTIGGTHYVVRGRV